MIRIGTRLGIIACRYLVKGYYDNRYICAPEIAEHYNMNVRSVMPSLRHLTHVGILRSRVGGNAPGFIFVKDPKQITLYQIMVALEGDIYFECCKDLVVGLKCDCTTRDNCSISALLNGIIDDASKQFTAISIAEHAETNSRNNPNGRIDVSIESTQLTPKK